MARLSLSAGFARNAVTLAIRKQWPQVEALIADALGVKPQELWPERYHEDGCPNVRFATHWVRLHHPHWRIHANRNQGPQGAV